MQSDHAKVGASWTTVGSNGVADINHMTKEKQDSPPRKKRPETRKNVDYDVSRGLKQLYNSVLDEPLPASFQDLLSKLDEGGR